MLSSPFSSFRCTSPNGQLHLFALALLQTTSIFAEQRKREIARQGHRRPRRSPLAFRLKHQQGPKVRSSHTCVTLVQEHKVKPLEATSSIRTSIIPATRLSLVDSWLSSRESVPRSNNMPRQAASLRPSYRLTLAIGQPLLQRRVTRLPGTSLAFAVISCALRGYCMALDAVAHE